jgi:hypothetical protein
MRIEELARNAVLAYYGLSKRAGEDLRCSAFATLGRSVTLLMVTPSSIVLALWRRLG